eukprot:1140930-Pelagomonas_calceolata.AAC.2
MQKGNGNDHLNWGVYILQLGWPIRHSCTPFCAAAKSRGEEGRQGVFLTLVCMSKDGTASAATAVKPSPELHLSSSFEFLAQIPNRWDGQCRHGCTLLGATVKPEDKAGRQGESSPGHAQAQMGWPVPPRL